MQNGEAYQCWLKHRTKGLKVKELAAFKKSQELFDAKLVFFESERQKLSAAQYIDWIYRQIEELEKCQHN